jgi:hypothetical protein
MLPENIYQEKACHEELHFCSWPNLRITISQPLGQRGGVGDEFPCYGDITVCP